MTIQAVVEGGEGIHTFTITADGLSEVLRLVHPAPAEIPNALPTASLR